MTPQRPRCLLPLVCVLPILIAASAKAEAQETIVINGNLQIADPESFGPGPVVWQTGYISSTGGPLTLPNSISFGPTVGTYGFQLGGPLTLSGPVDLGNTARTFNGAPNKTTFAGALSNGGVKLFGGTWKIQGNQPFAGGFTAINAVVEAEQSLSLGTAGVMATFDGAKLIQLNPFNIDRPIAVGFSGLVIDTASHDVTITGNVSRVSGVPSAFLSNLGPGTLTITSNSFQAMEIHVQGGIVKLNNANGVPIGRVFDGGTLSGIGSAGFTEVESGGRISPGDQGPGTFTLHSGLRLHGGSMLDFDLGVTSSDQIVFTHGNPDATVNPGEHIIVNLFDAGGLDEDQVYTLLDWTGGTQGSLSASAFELGTSPIDGHFEVVGSTLQFLTVPEPSVAALVSCMLLGLSARRPRHGRSARVR